MIPLLRFRAGLVLAMVLACVSVTAPGSTFHGGTQADCYGATDETGSGFCTQTFMLKTLGYVSLWETHVHFHELIPEITGLKTIKMEWRDRLSRLVWSSTCTDIGGSTEGTGTGLSSGPTDAVGLHCTKVYHRSNYARGTQTMNVIASGPVDGIPDPFHGRLIIQPPEALI